MIREFLKKTTEIRMVGRFSYQNIRPWIECKDGFRMSVQASEGHYCSPRECLDDGNYEAVEIGYPNAEEPLINEYAEDPTDYTDTVYGYVPVDVVDRVIEKHGGIINL